MRMHRTQRVRLGFMLDARGAGSLIRDFRRHSRMRFHLGAIPETPDFSPDATWRKLREPTPWVMQFLALPLGIIACVAVGILWHYLTPLRDVSLDSPGMVLILCVAIIPIHELIHAAVHPCSGRSANSILGFWPSRLLFYAHYVGELSRGRFIAILLMPLLIISFVPLLVCAFIGRSSALLAFASTLNALFACGDVFAVGLLLFQIPADATVRNQGWRTFWKIGDTDDA
jgi:hypothetical protein